MKIWVIDIMGSRAKLCISINNEEPEVLVGPKVIENEQALNKLLVVVVEEIRKQNSLNKKDNQGL